MTDVDVQTRKTVETIETVEVMWDAIDLLNDEAAALLRIDPASALEKAKKAEELARTLLFDVASDMVCEAKLAWSMAYQAHALYRISNYEDAVTVALETKAFTQKKTVLADAYGRVLYVLGITFHRLGDFPKTQAYLQELLSLSQKTHHVRHILLANNGLASLHWSSMRDYPTTITYYEANLRLIAEEKEPDLKLECFTYMNLNNTYTASGQFEKGLELALHTLELFEQGEDDWKQDVDMHLGILSNVASGYRHVGKFEEAHTVYRRILDRVELVNDNSIVVRILRSYGDFLCEQKMYEEAEAMLQDALALSISCQTPKRTGDCHQSLALVAEAKQEFDVALYHYKQFHTIYNEVLGKENVEKLHYLRVSYEVEVAQREAEIYRLRTEELEGLVEDRTADVLRALEQSEQANSVRSNMIKTIMHEFRTPLTVINGSVQLLEKYRARLPAEKQAKHFTNIKRSVLMLSQLLNEVSRVENSGTGNLVPNYSTAKVGKWSKMLVNYVRRETADPFNVTYVFDAADETPIEIDIEMTKAIVLELVTNGIKYTPDDKSITVEIGMDDGLAITIADEGMGIAADEIDKIYELFYRVYKAGDIPGLGTGLYVVKTMVERLGGTITATSVGAGLGTTFSILLPK